MKTVKVNFSKAVDLSVVNSYLEVESKEWFTEVGVYKISTDNGQIEEVEFLGDVDGFEVDVDVEVDDELLTFDDIVCEVETGLYEVSYSEENSQLYFKVE